MFGYILGPRLFDNPKGPLVRKQAFFPIPFGDIRLIQTTTIAPTTYLGNWAFIAAIKDVKFMVG